MATGSKRPGSFRSFKMQREDHCSVLQSTNDCCNDSAFLLLSKETCDKILWPAEGEQNQSKGLSKGGSMPFVEVQNLITSPLFPVKLSCARIISPTRTAAPVRRCEAQSYNCEQCLVLPLGQAQLLLLIDILQSTMIDFSCKMTRLLKTNKGTEIRSCKNLTQRERGLRLQNSGLRRWKLNYFHENAVWRWSFFQLCQVWE